MTAASNYLENALLNHTLTGTAYAQPGTRYIGLFRNVSTNAALNLEQGVLTDEVVGGSYARQIIQFAGSVAGTAATSNTVTFPTASAPWGTITHVAIMDAPSSGNVLFWGQVIQPKNIDTGDTFQVFAGNLTVTLA